MRNGVYHGFGCLVEKNETYEGEVREDKNVSA
jgi:hypothetical protein